MTAMDGGGTVDVETLRLELLRRAFLFDDPETYAAGVEDAIGAVSEELEALTARPA